MKNQLLFLGFLASFTALAQPGSLDPTFGSGGKFCTNFGGNDMGRSVVIQTDGKIIVAGSSDTDTSSLLGATFALARYNSNGTLDNTFDGDGKVTTDFGTFTAVGRDVALQADGKIVVVGYSHNGTDNDLAIARYNPNGSLDNTFDGDGMIIGDFGTSDEGLALAIQADGKIVVAGVSYIPLGQDFSVYRYNTNGSLDMTFDGDGKQITDFAGNFDVAYSITIQSDGKIILGGYAYDGTDNDFALARYNTNGSLDNTFDGDGKMRTDFGGDEIAMCLKMQADGKIVAVGFADIGMDVDFALARYNSNGSADNSFDSDGKTTLDFGSVVDVAYSTAIQNDGKIVVAGCSNDSTSGYNFALARYNSDGSPDMSFDSDGKLCTLFGSNDDYACGVALQADNKIVVAGMSSDGALYDFAVARYHYTLTGIEEDEEDNQLLQLFPNPSNGIFYLKNIPSDARVCIYDVTGNCIWNKTYGKGTTASIDLSNQAKGVYFMEMKSEGENAVRKIVLR